MKWLNECHYDGFQVVSLMAMHNYSAFEIAEAVERVLDVPLKQLKGKIRSREVADARKVYTLLCISLSLLKLKQIGQTIKKDHSTIIYQRDGARDLLKTDKEFIKKYYAVKESIKPRYE